ncbi:MAG TPA: SDR family NAD(P)-dependent oxidoreductase [Microthrixaceae bacterium]|nr:SDR family NAD(P)-dependent oxidoreductase [Microthrixaceae bacterium]
MADSEDLMGDVAADPAPIDPHGAIAVVTGGASGIGRAMAVSLLARGTQVVIADIEKGALDETVAALSSEQQERGSGATVSGQVVDVSDEASVRALADAVWDLHGGCDLLFLNAGVTSGGGGLPWQQEPNDWRWCFGVNVFGVGVGVSEFVPRMLAGGRSGQIVVTSSGDGGFAPVPTASVYAASKAAVSCFVEALQLNLISEGAAVRASVFYPSGGLMDTGLYTAARNRPEHLQRVGEGTGRTGMSFEALKARVSAALGKDAPVADVGELGEFAVDGACSRRFIIAHDLDQTAELLHARADAIGRGDLPPHHRMGV